jgi:Tfp pilus assembly protein PilF
MKSESIVFAVAGMCFGVILGWIVGSQQATGRQAASAAPAAASAQGQAPAAGGARQAPVLDDSRVQALTAVIDKDPKNAAAHVELANVYFDAERWDDAIQWYERSLKLDPGNPDVITDLGVSYYYTNRPDQALAQFEQSLKIDPKHTKTMLNKGVVLAFGKQDLRGAAEEWKRVVELSPDSPEGQQARRALEGVAAAHAGEPPAN